MAKKPTLNPSITNTLKKKPSSSFENINIIQSKVIDSNSPSSEKAGKVHKGRVEDNYTRSTYLIRNDLKDKLDSYSDSLNMKRGAKTVLINEALFHLFQDTEYLNSVMDKLKE